MDITKEINSIEELSTLLSVEFKENKTNKIDVTKKLESYGENILNNVHKELEKYIN